MDHSNSIIDKQNLLKVLAASKDVFPGLKGQERAKKQLKSALLSDRNVLLVGPPGIGKTTLAKNIAELLPEIEANDCEFHCDPKSSICPKCLTSDSPQKKKVSGSQRFIRIQGSPDLAVEDLLGDIDPVNALKYGPTSIEAFTPGKIFRANQGVLFFDEVNRCPEKLQNSLLQVLEEGKATIGSYKVDLPANFIFIGTMNPEDSSTEKLSDVFLDRFDVVYMDYPETLAIETEIVKERGRKLEVTYPEELLKFTVLFVRKLRMHPELQRKPSVRATLGLYERAQANALLESKTVTLEDIKDAILSVISHRIELKPSVKYLKNPYQFVEQQFTEFTEKNKDGKLKNDRETDTSSKEGGDG